MFLYIITNIVNNKQYIGITKKPNNRWNQHKLGCGSKLVYQAIKKYGLENFKFTILHKDTKERIKQLEVKLIAHYNTMAPHGYNLTAGGEGTTGWIPSKETREKWSRSHSGKNNGMYGKKLSKETKEKISQSRKGKNNGRAKRVFVNGKEYSSIKNAAKDLGIEERTLSARLQQYNKKNNWPKNWSYL